jgi:hypothetical protein
MCIVMFFEIEPWMQCPKCDICLVSGTHLVISIITHQLLCGRNLVNTQTFENYISH